MLMKKETRTVIYDEELRIQAYRFEGMIKTFPNHFHEYYVIGLIECGKRHLSCKNREYVLNPGNIVIFHPGDNHTCTQMGREPFDYRGFHISKPVMLDLAEEITGKRELPGFSENVICDEEAACHLRSLHELVERDSCNFGKEEQLLLLISALIERYGQPFESSIPECSDAIEQACRFMEEHFAEHISLEQVCHDSGLSKSTLLRAFTRSKGVTPYSYLENIRIGEARKLLEQGVPPVEAALRTGFSDQSHFTNYFSRFIGLAPGVYRDIFQNAHPGKMPPAEGKCE